jgi:hypothetical protein
MASEHTLQVAIAQYLGWVLQPPVWWTGIDHAAKLSPVYGALRKRRGVKRGIGDFLIIAPGPNVLFIEVKNETGRMTPEQREFAAAMHACQVWCVLCRSVEEVAKALDYIRVPKTGEEP